MDSDEDVQLQLDGYVDEVARLRKYCEILKKEITEKDKFIAALMIPAPTMHVIVMDDDGVRGCDTGMEGVHNILESIVGD